MITITNKTDCCGCGACASRCMTSCITMAPDEEGFNYPLVDTDKCIHCKDRIYYCRAGGDLRGNIYNSDEGSGTYRRNYRRIINNTAMLYKF